MSITVQLAVTQAALLVILVALGAGPASLLSRRFDAAGRIALAPVLGFCLGTCLMTTLLEFFPARDTYPLVAVLAIASATVAACRTLSATEHRWPSLRDVAQLLVVCVAVTAPLNFVLQERHTLGPAAYYFTDVDNYVGTQQAAADSSLADAREAWVESARTDGRFENLTDGTYAFLADFGSNLDATPLWANVNELLGTAAIDSFSAFLNVLLLMGGLGAFAAVRYVAWRPTWTAALAGGLFGGPLFLELWFDSFQAAIIALALILPAVVLGAEALRERRLVQLALVALVMGTFVSSYPLFIPPLVAIGGAAVLWQAVLARRSGASLNELARSLGVPGAAVALMSLAVNPVGLVRSVGYYQRVLGGGIEFPRVSFTLPPDVLPGWLAQTREFWLLVPLDVGAFKELVLGVLIPLVVAGFAAVAVRRHRIALALLGLAAFVCCLAYYAYASQEACTYCAERYLLALAPVLAAVLALGLAQATGSPSRVWKAVGIGGVVLVALAVGQRTRVELDRFADVSYFFDTATRGAIDDLPHDGRAVQVEGFWASTNAQAEQPLTYHLATDRAPGRVSISLGTNAGNALQYVNHGNVMAPGVEFKADYRYLLTRFSGVATDRRLVVRRGAIGLMERTRPLDVTPYSGLSIPQARIDGSGVPWVQTGSPLGFYVVGPTPGRVWARLTFATSTPVRVPAQPGVRARSRPSEVTVCVRATGKPPIRNAGLAMPSPAPGVVRLVAMRAVTGRCGV